MKRYYLAPNNGRKSFYGKAEVLEDGGIETLFSYGTPVIQRKNGRLTRLWDHWTLTTGTHIKAFCGLTKKEYLALPMV